VIELLKFSHDPDVNFGKSCDDLKKTIDAFTEQSELERLYDYFKFNYSLPKDVVKQQIRKYLESRYNYRTCAFSTGLLLRKIPQAFVRHIGFILYVLFKSRKYKKEANTYELIIEWIASMIELNRFSKLINLFGKENVLITTVRPLIEMDYNIIYRPLYKFYDLKKVVHVFYREIIQGLVLYLKLSFGAKVNIIPIASHIINQYLYYSSIFKYNRAKYCIQERQYQTNAIKNFLFRKYGGIHSTSLQKNLYQIGRNGFYYDADILFVLGNRTVERAFKYGARIDHVVPAGSMFMEYYWFDKQKEEVKKDKRYDIIYIGINSISSLDTYSEFRNDYYETFKWLVRFSLENPNLKVCIKHHKSNVVDKNEVAIVKDSPVERIDQELNSYDVAFKAKCAVTFCSTMGYELIGHGFPTLFLDPGRRNIEILPEDDLIDEWRVTTYDEFKDTLEDILKGRKITNNKTNPEDLCLKSENVAERMHSYLINSKEMIYEKTV